MMNERNQKGMSLCLAGWWPEPGNVAGIFIREHVKAIAERRPVQVIFMKVMKSPSPWPRIHENSAMEEGVLVHRIVLRTPLRRAGIPKLLARLAYRRFFRTIARHQHIDVVHIHVRTDVTEQALPVAHSMKLPVVLTEHNSYYHLGILDRSPNEQATERAAMRRWLADPGIAHIMPVSCDLMRVLEKDYGVANDRMTVVRNVAATVFKPGSTTPTGTFRILLASVWRPPKDHDVFIRALATLSHEQQRSIVVEWVGFGPDMETIKLRCSTELPRVNILFSGRLEKPELADAMRRAHLFVHPTTADNLPCVVLESLCCGTPVISMRVNGVPEMIDAQNGLLVTPGDHEALASALLAVMNGDVVFDRSTIAANAAAIYAPHAVGAAIEAIYEQVIPTHEHP